MYSLNCKGKILSLDEPVVMGIINITPDSLYEGHLDRTANEIGAIAETMIRNRASILDIGGQSTRPGSTLLTAEEEAERILPVIIKLAAEFPDTVISVDTFYSEVAVEAVKAGARMVNDISGGLMDERMLIQVGQLNVPYICMHMKGTPQTMVKESHYENIIAELFSYFSARIYACKAAGIKDIILDPGFGFSKNISQNFHLLRNLHAFTNLEYPILAGLSRKSTIYKTLGVSAAEALNGSTVLHTIALQQGANILRVHDVQEAVETVRLLKALRES